MSIFKTIARVAKGAAKNPAGAIGTVATVAMAVQQAAEAVALIKATVKPAKAPAPRADREG